MDERLREDEKEGSREDKKKISPPPQKKSISDPPLFELNSGA
jgi:hypothetical protein